MQLPSQASIWALWAEMRETLRVGITILLFTSARLLACRIRARGCYQRVDASLEPWIKFSCSSDGDRCGS